MLDHVRSPYGPREIDVTGKPEHWPCGTGLEVIVKVGDSCAANGCDGVVGVVTARTEPGFAPFCAKCRHRGRVGVERGSTDEAGVVEWLRAGLTRPARFVGPRNQRRAA